MEMEPSTPVIAKKMWNIVRVLFYMLRKGISKSKLMADLHMMLKRGKIAAGNLKLHHHSALSCRSDDVRFSFISPQEYEFSCSNSPVYPSYHTRRKSHHYNHHRQGHYQNSDDINIVQKVIDMLNNEMAVEASPLTLPGFGKSPMVRQLRITDSPFPLKNDDKDDGQVDKKAEEFIKKFYKDLKHQKRMAALQSPSPFHLWAR
ncbi:uncharacterized protein LOC132280101 [Cornus florida]|uniref:uncharacterized protein LOC132280101 n=1 Tax=Cornus florida TaxID=4283 RepID=UPI0028A172E2|nr:uncharacterized protein LOC132280101 [Cornus florida]